VGDRVLVLDDEASILDLLGQLLSEVNYDCTLTTSALEALELLEGGGFSLLMTDLKMPEMHGLEVVQRAKQLDRDLAVIVVTALLDVTNAIEALRGGADDYLLKPFNLNEICLAVEKALNIEVPERAEYLRVIADELNRIISHLVCVGVMAMDIGAITPFPYALRERETINDLIEELCGSRLTYNYCKIGGVSHDLPAGWIERCHEFLNHFELILPEFDRLITYNEIFVDRCANVAAISADEAIAHGLVGPNLRASGVNYDVRRDLPYSVYDQLDFDVAVGTGALGTTGDCWDRFWVRLEEMKQSARIVRQCLSRIPEGPIYNKPKRIRPKGEAWARCETSRGDMLCYVVGAGQATPERVHFRTGSFNAMQVVKPKSPGVMVADLVALIASLDVIAPEIDR